MDNIIEYIRTYGQNTFDQKMENTVCWSAPLMKWIRW